MGRYQQWHHFGWKPSSFHLACWIWPTVPSDHPLANWMTILELFVSYKVPLFISNPKQQKKSPKLQGWVISKQKQKPCQEAWTQ